MHYYSGYNTFCSAIFQTLSGYLKIQQRTHRSIGNRFPRSLRSLHTLQRSSFFMSVQLRR